MNKLILILAFFSGGLQVQNESVPDRYPFKSGMIVYQYAGRENCTEVIYFDDYGDLFYDLKTTISERKGVSNSSSKLKIQRQDTVILLDPDKLIASKHLELELAFKLKHNIVDLTMLHNMGYTLAGYEEISGVICNKYSGENGTMWIWNNIILKSEIEIMEIKIEMVAIKVITNMKVAESIFKLPKNYKLIN